MGAAILNIISLPNTFLYKQSRAEQKKLTNTFLLILLNVSHILPTMHVS